MRHKIHVIDPNTRRRARIVHDFAARNLHAEIYEDLEELAERFPNDGCIFAVDDQASSALDDIMQTVKLGGAGLPVVIYSDQPSPEKVVDGILLGALDYLEWPFDPRLLEKTFRRVNVEGGRRGQHEKARSGAKKQILKLSPREKQVLLHLVQGLANKDIAIALGISPRTVEIHRGNMMRKLDAQSAADAVRIALYAGLDEAMPSF